MSGHALGIIELVLVFGAVVGWAGWELWTLRRARQQREQQREPRQRQDAERR